MYTSAVIFFSFCRVHYRNNSVTDEPRGCKGACIPTWWTQKAQNLKDNNASRMVRRLRKTAKSDYSLRHVRLSARPHGTTRLPLDGFSWNLISEYFSEICREIQVSLKSDKTDWSLHEDQYTILIYLTHFFLEWELFQTNLYRKSKHIFCSIILFLFFRKSCSIWDVEK